VECEKVDAAAIAVDVAQVSTAIDETIGPSGTARVIVYDQGQDTGAYNPTFDSILLPSSWSDPVEGEPTGVVHHEAGHAFFDAEIGTNACGGSGQQCNNTIIEHWGLDEGIAMILQKVVGNGTIGDPTATR